MRRLGRGKIAKENRNQRRSGWTRQRFVFHRCQQMPIDPATDARAGLWIDEGWLNSMAQPPNLKVHHATALSL